MTTEITVEEAIGKNPHLQNIHCPWCGGTSVKLVNGQGKFVGQVGNCLAIYHCSSCDRNFNLMITGDDFFPDRGFGVTPEDYNVKFA